MAWVHAGPAQVLCGFKSSIYCLHGSEAIRSAGPRGPCAGAAVPIPFDAARVPDSVRCGPVVWRGSTRVHARPRRSEREGLESEGNLLSGPLHRPS